ncbi:TonB-dependent siderophore receptor [Acinetobacter sp. MD2(2019)]|uniref:TonB-dependent siderophore receptor n=1 Tax=Acinetobacter sp. MD2(2019) TaxID=2605273 RepID=UPI002D1F68EC|nr:TonB-dependent siderophore receptor [Acinetobacter sp. MD2(2019)]MEB3754882.1 TonB-dependent siderophore receptor [Acinetobacter sp. MD2(2019)]
MNRAHFQYHTLYQSILVSIIAIATSAHAQDEALLSTITVHANNELNSRYASNNINIIGLGLKSLNTPASVSVVTAERMADQHAKLLTDVVKNDASVGDGYAPVGYYPNFVARGFSLNQASSYLINGQPIRGEQNVALENKEQVEILKGISAIQSDMSTPAGVINYVTKRPKDVNEVGFDINSEGNRSISTDIGGFLGQQKQFGYRVNLAQEALRPYVEHSNGERTFGSVALDWTISDHSQLQFDLESQRQKQRSVAGYQLLDNQTVPSDTTWDRALGYQSWSKPVTINSLNSSLKYNYQFNEDWSASLTASHSQVKIDDYSAFPYGFYADGSYDIYDYEQPNDRRRTDQMKANVSGYFSTGKLEHRVTMSLSQTQKTQKQYEGINNNLDLNKNPMTGNIYSPTNDYLQPKGSLGAYYKALDNQQTAFSLQDLIQLNAQWSTLVGGKWLHVNEKAYNAEGSESRHTQMDKFLPQAAVMYHPFENTHFYASYAKGLADGGQAPWNANNAYQVLAPIQSEQYEIGVKQQLQNFFITAAVYQLTQDNQYINDARDFVQQGKQRNRGVELAVSGDLTSHLAVMSSASWTQARLVGIGTNALTGHQSQNVPVFKAATHLSYEIPAVEGLRVLGGLQYSARKYANKTGTVSVPGYTIFDAGAAYNFKWSNHETVLRLNVDNLLNKKYWRDAGGYLGDDYLFLGSPRTATLSVSFNF